MASLGRTIFQLGYELSPVILTNGIANSLGGMLPIIAITQAANFVLGILNGTSPIDPNDFFAHFRPLPGSTLIDNDIAEYPFANQAVAANSIITKPLRVSLLMTTPVNQPGGYLSKLVTFSALKATLDLHIQQGGTFTIATPSFIYTNCLLQQFRDVSGSQSNQAQNAWQLDFTRPLLTEVQAAQVVNSLLQRVGGGAPQNSTAWSSIENSLGISPQLASLFAGTANAIGSHVTNVVGSVNQALGLQ